MKRLREWFDFHRTARSRFQRQSKAIEYWMEEAKRLERQYADVTPAFVAVDFGNGVAPTIRNEDLGEQPPLEALEAYEFHEDCRCKGDFEIKPARGLSLNVHQGPGL